VLLVVVLVSMSVVNGEPQVLPCTCLKRYDRCVLEINKAASYMRRDTPPNCCCKAELLPKVSSFIIGVIINDSKYVYVL